MDIKTSTIAKSETLSATPEVVTPTEPIVATPPVTEPTADIVVPPTEQPAEPTVTEPVVEARPPVQDEVIAFDFPTDEPTEPTVEQPTVAAPQPVNWKEAIKDVPEDELAEILGDDDFIKGMRKHIKNGGSPMDYLTARAVNWETVSDVDILKNELRQEFPDATPAQIDRLFNKKYNQTELAEEEDKEDGILLMKSDARKLRSQKIENQKKFQIADARIITAPPQQAQTNEIDEQHKAQFKKDLEFIGNHNAHKQLFESKRVAIEVADNVKLNMGISNPQALMDIWFKQGKLFSLTRTPQGEPDVQLMQEAAMFFANPKLFKSKIFNAGKEAGVKSLVEEGQNAGKQATVLPMQTTAGNYGELFNSGNIKVGTAAKFAQQ